MASPVQLIKLVCPGSYFSFASVAGVKTGELWKLPKVLSTGFITNIIWVKVKGILTK